MTDLRTSFAVLEDSSSGAGLPLHKVLEGDAAAAKNALASMVARNGANLAYLKVDPTTGALIVTTEGAKDCVHAKGELAAGSATLALVTGAELTLVASTVYENIGFVVSCQRDALFQIVQVDDVTETVIAEFIVGAGAYTVSNQIHCFKFTTGATGVQKLKVMAMNFNAQSSLRATITAEKIL